MSYYLKLLLVLLLCVKQEADLAIAVRKFVYQKDMSEYCRRRVMPSVFLGRQVTEAYSQILHFSRLELPYSCFVSIRTESGSNIILVIQLMSDKSLIDSCRESKNQLLVYEIGETFGGYWGPLPDSVMKADTTTDTNVYTLKTTQPTTTVTTERRTTRRRTTPSTRVKHPGELDTPLTDRKDYITVEVPIVNVSAVLVPGRLPTDTIFDPEERFDAMFDVTWAGMSYQTKVLPLVQFSMENAISARRDDGEEISPRFELDFNSDMFTPDSRLLFPLLGPATKKHANYNYNVNKRLHFKKSKHPSAEKEDALNTEPPFSYYRSPLHSMKPANIFTRHYNFMDLSTNKHSEPSYSWEVIDDILKNLSKTKDKSVLGDKNLADLLYGLSKVVRNDSVFLVPNTSMNKHSASTSRPITTKYKTDSITWRQPSASYRTNYLDEVVETLNVGGLSQDDNNSNNTWNAMKINDPVNSNDGRSGALLPLALDVDGVILNVTSQRNRETLINILNHTSILPLEVRGTTVMPKTMKPLTLVDHESWENMVHAASLMAVVLNQSVVTKSENDKKQTMTVSQTKPINVRKKRFIHAIPIDHAKPHHLPMKMDIPSSTLPTDKVADAQDFQRLIELQDDEIHDRVALRYLRQYVGPALFNICDFDEAAARHVYLFNSSRLVLAISNFTLERMTVVMTPARTLLTSDARCTDANLECQVSGARVCIDSLSACDGVPNCGSYDIYDEDRLTCGGSAGLQHNVCLAAITFLAVLLTILYTVHYWLKRCVPRVSDAFFIYTDAAENVLYLDSIMRSPYDTDEGKDFYRGTNMQDYMDSTDMTIKKNTVGSLVSRLLRVFGCKRKKQVPRDEIIDEEFGNIQSDPQRLFSFAEVELSKVALGLVSDAAVQTGSSLEIKEFDKTNINERMLPTDSDTDDIVAHYEGRKRSEDKRSFLDMELLSNQPSDELSILKFFRKARSVSMQVSSPEGGYKIDMASQHLPHTEEKEIQCHVYDHDIACSSNIASSSLMNTRDKKADQVHKKLRFEEETKTMQSGNVDNDAVEDEIVVERPRRSIAFTSSKNVRIDEAESSTDTEEPSGGTNREADKQKSNKQNKSYFWSKSKPKKQTKKKTQLSLR